MIVGERFPGDDDDALQWAQHDAYARALTILVSGARRRLADAEGMLETRSPLGVHARTGRFDHHVVQDAHDLLAARWRLSCGYVHPTLPGFGEATDEKVEEWLRWLTRWIEHECEPRLVRAILQVAYADPRPGYPDETLLLETLSAALDEEVARNAWTQKVDVQGGL